MFHTSKYGTQIRSTLFLAATAVTAATVLSACGNSDSTDAAAGSTHTAANGEVYSDADVRFAQRMIPHHAQAIEMADMTRGRELSPQVAQLAAAVMEAQTPEIETMTGWLTSWGEEIPETMRDHANAHSDGMGDTDAEDMPGMMSQEDLDALESATDTDFEDMWLEMMIEHHQGAIEMARDEQDSGAFSPAVDLAEDIETGQTAEVEQMTDLLDR